MTSYGFPTLGFLVALSTAAAHSPCRTVPLRAVERTAPRNRHAPRRVWHSDFTKLSAHASNFYPDGEGAYELGILSHVLEHVPDPAALLAEAARACDAVLVEVPLEANLSARRAFKREHSDQVGHLQRLDRAAARAIVARAGLQVACELEDPLGLAVQRFFATTPIARARATAKWALRAGLHRLAPGLARRLFTVHYACLCLPAA